jgi:hypothetical protein
MQANKLIVGNWVNYKKGNITKLEIEDFAEMAHNEGFLNMIEPIPLTKEWLYKLADEVCIIEKMTEDSFTVDRFRLVWKPEYEYWYVLDDLELTYITKVEFVHEWQNVFAVLNGRELTIKN